MKLKFKQLARRLHFIITGTNPSTETAVYAVEEFVVFKNVYMVRAQDKDSARELVKSGDPEHYFQKHLISNIACIKTVCTDSEFLQVLNETEQPDMTLEDFTNNRDSWWSNVNQLPA